MPVVSLCRKIEFVTSMTVCCFSRLLYQPLLPASKAWYQAKAWNWQQIISVPFHKPICGADEVSGLYYGPKHPMKPHRITMTHHLVLAYELHDKFDMYVRSDKYKGVHRYCLDVLQLSSSIWCRCGAGVCHVLTGFPC